MSDNPLEPNPQDDDRINVNVEAELAYWGAQFGVPRARLADAIEQVGPRAVDLQKYLGIPVVWNPRKADLRLRALASGAVRRQQLRAGAGEQHCAAVVDDALAVRAGETAAQTHAHVRMVGNVIVDCAAAVGWAACADTEKVSPNRYWTGAASGFTVAPSTTTRRARWTTTDTRAAGTNCGKSMANRERE
ncbi:DUF3606 domain-containing protein [Massilia violaceinigra]|uniref:DUF3606 domain-containing protein n=1 Tax=Massilia violaceinigra TaxID=2045208 RepID=A0ABY4A3J4_9BURK|nr:DUF3606 domain-containing protein [Massilia violaceinigra]UOD28259.1 DUF3606 domain-containing protein [Massilia violaceinigra]